jgi:pterin-4a-carbinolamine dehydratase
MYFGIELERSKRISVDYKQKAKDGWRCERDCSVEAEYISPVLSLDNYEESIDFIKSTAQDILD